MSGELREIYWLATLGRAEAYQFLCLWHEWCHQIDDLVDGMPGCVIDVCADAAVLFTNPFFVEQASRLLPVVAVVAEKYRTSLLDAPELDFLRFAGNDMVLSVAAICGGRALVRQVSDRLWPVVIQTQIA